MRSSFVLFASSSSASSRTHLTISRCSLPYEPFPSTRSAPKTRGKQATGAESDSLVSLEELGSEEEMLPCQGGREGSTELLSGSDVDERRVGRVVLRVESKGKSEGGRSGPIRTRSFVLPSSPPSRSLPPLPSTWTYPEGKVLENVGDSRCRLVSSSRVKDEGEGSSPVCV